MEKRLLVVFMALASITSEHTLVAEEESTEESAARMFKEAQPYWLTQTEFQREVREKSPYIEAQMYLEELGFSKEEIREHIARFLENKDYSPMAQLLCEIYNQKLPRHLKESPLGEEVNNLKQALHINYLSNNLDTSNFIHNHVLVEALIRLKPDVKEILLAEAIKHNADKTFHILLSHIDVNTVALIWAARNNRLDVVQALLQVPGINANLQDSAGDSALVMAARNNNLDIVRALLQVPRINVNLQDAQGRTALMKAASNGNRNMVEALLEVRGIDVNLQFEDGATALMFTVAKDNLEITKALLQVTNINVNLSTKDGSTPLMYAISRDYPSMVRALLRAPNIDVNLQNIDGHSALMFAVTGNNLDMVQALLRMPSINVNLQNIDGDTALSKAKSEPIRTLLLQHGATE